MFWNLWRSSFLLCWTSINTSTTHTQHTHVYIDSQMLDYLLLFAHFDCAQIFVFIYFFFFFTFFLSFFFFFFILQVSLSFSEESGLNKLINNSPHGKIKLFHICDSVWKYSVSIVLFNSFTESWRFKSFSLQQLNENRKWYQNNLNEMS